MNPAVLAQLILILPRLLEAGAEVYLRIAAAKAKKEQADLTWEEFVAAVAAISIRDVDALIAEGEIASGPRP